MISFTDFKKSRTDSFAKLTKKIQEMNEYPKNDDDRFWQPTVDKAGNGYAVIRFLPEAAGEEMPFIRMWDHGFKGPGGWYIEKSLTTLGKPDPVSEYNTKLWNSGRKEDKDVVSGTPGNPGTKRRLTYVANIFVIDDPAKPENNGKVFLFRFGKKIYDKLNDLMNPKFPDEKAVDPFNFWNGANFKMKIRNYEGYRNYDKSEFDAASPLNQDDQILQKIWESEHKLQPLVDPALFKSYDELREKLYRVLSQTSTAPTSESTVVAKAKEAPTLAAKSTTVEDEVPWDTEDEDDELAQFKALAAK
jgi:gp32 DNA binding protein like